MCIRPLDLMISLCWIPFLLIGQGNPVDEIKNPGPKRIKKCRKYYEIVSKLPIDVRYDLEVKNGEIYFYFRDEDYFDKIFDKCKDGIAVDIIDRSQIDCENGNQLGDSWAHRGELLPPIFRKELRKKIIPYGNGVKINFGQLPKHYVPSEIECNLIVLQKRFHCGYYLTSGMEFNDWELLDLGLYSDSIPREVPKEFEANKSLTFTIPFEKDRSAYEPEDIRPIYDSLHLSDYDIKSVDIRAYTSVEGTTTRNEELQHQRATSLIKAMEAFQHHEIPFNVSAIENWDSFYQDIHGTQYQYLSRKQREQIKEELQELAKESEMEAILSKHRIGVITMNLQKKVTVFDDPETLVEVFAQKVKLKQLTSARFLQYAIFDQIRNEQLPDDFIGRLEIPQIAELGPLMVNDLVFQYGYGRFSDDELLKAFKELSVLIPDNQKVQYNLVALQLRSANSFRFGKHRKSILALIKKLRHKIDPTLYTRIWVNYNLLETDFFDQRNAYRHKNKAIRAIYQNYKSLDLSDEERLYLARFLSRYSRFNWAEKVLAQRVYDEDVAPELIDYYFRLTLKNPDYLKKSNYQQLIAFTAENHNVIFCNLFKTKAKGGYTFQLLLNESLADIYCASCN